MVKMTKDKLLNKESILFYLKVGLVFFVLNLLGNLSNDDASFIRLALNSLWLLIYLIAVNYFVFDFAAPFIKLRWRRIIVAPLVIGFCLLLYSIGLYKWRDLGIFLSIYTPLTIFTSICDGIKHVLPNGLSSLFFFGIIRHVYNYRKLVVTAQQLRIEKQEAELNFLKSQTNPHFLFNTLNNIYALARDKNDLAEEAILKLSALLRFMLYETNVTFISVDQELKVINDYIALEKLRYDESLKVNFEYEIDKINQSIPPLLLIPLVENAFKHGVSESRSTQFVDIHFVVKNSYEKEQDSKVVKENIGLGNLRKQLTLLFSDFNLISKYEKNQFLASLHIGLESRISIQNK
jgi:two-component system, LytTR family, sensor kinase